jgi:predicted PhzF superfamily epimerase YddE/YHI9
LSATRHGERIELDFPARPAEPCDPTEGLLEALGVRATAVGRSHDDWLVELGSAAEVRACKPDFHRLKQVRARGVIVTSRSDDAQFDCVSRFFAPGSGIDEDPVTGSAHCTIGPWWGTRLGRSELTAHQASQRGGTLQLVLDGDRVRMRGQAVTVLRGELLVTPA